ncbi:MAG: primosomal protein N', partial [Pseudobdellovibrionaceae bacterium]
AQSLLFLNRRGYAPLTLCRTCGHRFECPRCTSWLVEHRASNSLACHHCGYHIKVPDTCPECDDTDSLAPCGPGVERIEEEVKHAFPDAKVMTLSSDMSEDQTELRSALDKIRDHKIDIVVGTQIIAKGHHFPKLELVGVVDADLGLHGGDLRAAERSYQLLHQVAGRAGREKGSKGRVYLQSWNPAARVIQALASGDRDQFLEAEAEERSAAHMPPYARLAAIIVSSPKEAEAGEIARKLASNAPNGPGVMTYGPAPAPLYRIRGKYRYRLLVHAEKQLNIQKSIAAWIASHKIPSTARVQVDIDPQSFL